MVVKMNTFSQEILYEDMDILVCHKPAGIAVQTAKVGERDMVSILKTYLKTDYLGVIHRLDQPVQGILVFAKKKKAAALLTDQSKAGTMIKTYEAIVPAQKEDGEVGKAIILEDYLVKNPKDNTSRIGKENDQDAKKSRLSYVVTGKRVIKDKGACMMVKIQLETGRHHQIRVQMANAGLPLLGDQKYGNEESIALSRQLGVKNIALCAAELSFAHPFSKKRMKFKIKPEGEIFTYFLEDIT